MAALSNVGRGQPLRSLLGPSLSSLPAESPATVLRWQLVCASDMQDACAGCRVGGDPSAPAAQLRAARDDRLRGPKGLQVLSQ